jgi:predicted GIY-YIG superfamily endonuclease
MTIKQRFLDELDQVFRKATVAGQDHVAVSAGDLHRSVGGYRGPTHKMPVCCQAMRSAMDPSRGDRVVSEPPKGKGASLTIRYVLPRPSVAASSSARPRISGPAADEVSMASRAGRSHVHPDFLQAVEALHGKFEKLSHMAAAKPIALPKDAPAHGVYLFSEGARPMYVGRTKNLKQRIGNHCGNSARENQAVFAFKLAREATGKPKAAYTTEGSRAALMKDAAFAASFKDAKERVRRMDLRYVEETDSLRQALLEMYVAVVLRTPYNDFDTH